MRTAPPFIGALLLTLSACHSIPAGKPSAPAANPVTEEAAPVPSAGISIPLSSSSASPAQVAALFPGSGKLLHEPASAAASSASASNGIQFTFNDSNISEIVATVLGEGLGLNYSIDPQVKGTMSLQSSGPLARDQVLPALEDALGLQGFGIVANNGLYRVVPLKNAQRATTTLRLPDGKAGAGYGVQIVLLHYIGAQEMQKILEPFAPQDGIVRVDEARNLLELAGTSSQLRGLLDIVQLFDVDWLAGMSFAIYPLSNVDAKTLTAELGEVFTDARSPLAGVVRLVAIARLNAILVITPEAHYLSEVQQWIKRLDLGGSTSGRRIYVYEVQNRKADDLAKSLKAILSISGSTSTSDTSTSAPLVAGAGLTGTGLGASALTSGSRTASSGRTLSGSGLTGMSSSATMTGATVPTSSANSKVSDVSSTPTSSNAGIEGGDDLRIVTDESSNSLLIMATPGEFGIVQSALLHLDQSPGQVLIEASIAEVSLTDDLQFGLQWSRTTSGGIATLSNASNGGIDRSFPGFSYLYTGNTSIAAVLNTIQAHTNVHVLSSPKLIVLNNHPAVLNVGDEVPIITQSAVSTVSTNAPIVNSVEMKDTGVILQVIPHVNKSGLVLLDITQQVSDVIPTTTSSINSPTIKQRNLSTSVAVKSGDTIALGGLISSNTSQNRSGIPFLSRIPGLGALFGATTHSTQRTELIMLLTPRIIQSSTDLEAASEDLRNEFRDLKKDIPKSSAGH